MADQLVGARSRYGDVERHAGVSSTGNVRRRYLSRRWWRSWIGLGTSQQAWPANSTSATAVGVGNQGTSGGAKKSVLCDQLQRSGELAT